MRIFRSQVQVTMIRNLHRAISLIQLVESLLTILLMMFQDLGSIINLTSLQNIKHLQLTLPEVQIDQQVSLLEEMSMLVQVCTMWKTNQTWSVTPSAKVS